MNLKKKINRNSSKLNHLYSGIPFSPSIKLEHGGEVEQTKI